MPRIYMLDGPLPDSKKGERGFVSFCRWHPVALAPMEKVEPGSSLDDFLYSLILMNMQHGHLEVV